MLADNKAIESHMHASSPGRGAGTFHSSVLIPRELFSGVHMSVVDVAAELHHSVAAKVKCSEYFSH